VGVVRRKKKDGRPRGEEGRPLSRLKRGRPAGRGGTGGGGNCPLCRRDWKRKDRGDRAIVGGELDDVGRKKNGFGEQKERCAASKRIGSAEPRREGVRRGYALAQEKEGR